MDTGSKSPSNGLAEARLAATAAAVSGDAATLYHLVAGFMDDGFSLETVLFEILAPLQRDVGIRWQSGDYLVSEEHAATATVETVVSLLSGAVDRPRGGPEVVVAAAPGDQHSLPARLVAAQLLFAGYRTIFLGANVLASDLEEFLQTEPPTALVLSCSMTGHLVGAREAVRAAHTNGAPVLVGGRGFGERGEWASIVGADGWAESAGEVARILESWTPDPAASEASAMDPTSELLRLMRRRSEIVAAALDSLDARGLPTDNRVGDELSILLGAVEASLLVDDHQPAALALAWQEETLASHRLPLASAIAEALRHAVADICPGTERVLIRTN